MNLINCLKKNKMSVITNNSIFHAFMKEAVKMLIVVALCVLNTVVVKVSAKNKLKDVNANTVDLMKKNVNIYVLVSIKDLNVILLFANVLIAIMLIY